MLILYVKFFEVLRFVANVSGEIEVAGIIRQVFNC